MIPSLLASVPVASATAAAKALASKGNVVVQIAGEAAAWRLSVISAAIFAAGRIAVVLTPLLAFRLLLIFLRAWRHQED